MRMTFIERLAKAGTPLPAPPASASLKPRDRLLLNRAEAAAYLGVSLGHFVNEVKKGNLPQPVFVGSVSRWVRVELERAYGAASVSPASSVDDGDEWDLT